MARSAGLPQNVVDDDVDLARGRAERPVRGVLVAGQRDNLVGAERGERAEPPGIASGADHASGAEQPGDLDRHQAGVPGRAEHQDALAGLDRYAAPQRHPRRHGRVHRGGDLGDVGAVG